MCSIQRHATLIALLVLCAVALSGTAEAARRSGLAGNLLIEDADDVFIFPQLNLEYANQFIIDMGPDANNGTVGSGTFLFGTETWALNLSTHRSQYLNSILHGFYDGTDRGLFPLAFSPDLTGVAPGHNPLTMQWFDVGYATMLGLTPFGVRVSSGVDVTKQENGTEVKQSASAYAVQAGASLGNMWDITGEITFGSSENSDSATPGGDLDGDVTGFSAGVRGYMNGAGFDWGVLGAFGYSSASVDVAPDSTRDQKITDWLVGFGPVWRDEPENWQVAGYVTVQQQMQKIEFAAGGENKQSLITLPGYRFAAERRLWKWLWVYGGVRSDYQFEKTENGTTVRTRDYTFRWTGGVSVDLGRFQFDGAINEPWVETGPSFIGADENFLAFASATYRWGGDD